MRSLRLRGVSVGSELSTQEERDGWEAALGCAVRDEYSSEELGRIASQCPEKRYHLHEDIVHAESSVRTGGPPTVSARWSGPSSTTGPCRSCATGRAISRKSASSSARAAGVAASSSTLPVGRTTASSSPTVERSPRASSWTSATGPSSLPATRPSRPAYQFVQRSPTQADFEVVPGPAYEPSLAATMRASLERELAGCGLTIRVLAVDAIERKPGGKRATVFRDIA